MLPLVWRVELGLCKDVSEGRRGEKRQKLKKGGRRKRGGREGFNLVRLPNKPPGNSRAGYV